MNKDRGRDDGKQGAQKRKVVQTFVCASLTSLAGSQVLSEDQEEEEEEDDHSTTDDVIVDIDQMKSNQNVAEECYEVGVRVFQ